MTLMKINAGLQAFEDAESALNCITALYEEGIARLRDQVAAFLRTGVQPHEPAAFYPYIEIAAEPNQIAKESRLAYGMLPGPGRFAATLTRPDLLKDYYLEQLNLLLEHHGPPLFVGNSDCAIPLPFVDEPSELNLDKSQAEALQRSFPMPDLAQLNDHIPNGLWTAAPDRARPLSLFNADRVDYSLMRLKHYTATSPRHFQRFVLFTNYQRYVEEFVAFGRDQVAGDSDYLCFVEAGGRLTPNPKLTTMPGEQGRRDASPQMPAYHLVRGDGDGITLINIGVGPANAKTITDHLAVLRPHCWMMVGHCGGLRMTQRLGDYVLAHAYVRGDHVLDEDLPVWVPIPPIAEVQVALTEAVAEVTGLKGRDMKTRLRTGTVFTTDDRDWELRHSELSLRIHQSRAIAVDMESATIATNGYRFRVPYGTLLCVSDKPLHGELKLPGMADAFYRQRISQHLEIGIKAIDLLRAAGVRSLHSRKLRSFDEPAFR